MSLRKRIDELEELYARFNRRELAAHDPISFLYEYPDPQDREVAAVVASSLAYGRVAQILADVRKVLAGLGDRPARRLRSASDSRLRGGLAGFRHRFTTGRHMADLLCAVRDVRREFGSLNRCFLAGIETERPAEAGTFFPAIAFLVGELRRASGGIPAFLLPSPSGGSACKRLNLMLRWLVRRDAVDPGGWEGASPDRLLVPLDVHMHRVARRLGATRRKSADLRTVLEVTSAFRLVCPQDPVRYDFALTRAGILGSTATVDGGRRRAPAALSNSGERSCTWSPSPSS